MASTGTFISGLGHVGLIGWLILGWGLDAEPLRIETMDVSMISGEEFDQMRARATPDPGDADPQAPVPPEIDEAPPAMPPVARPTDPVAVPEPVTPPQSETPPAPVPQQDTVQAEDQPPPAPPPPPAPQPEARSEVTPEAAAPQAPTVASTINAPPPPEADIDDIVRDAIVPDDSATAEVEVEEQDQTAPEETTTEIVIDDLAPTTSVRPMARPARPVAAPEPPVQTATPDPAPAPAPAEPTVAETEEDVAAALAEAVAAQSAPAVAAGPPLTGSERDSFRLAVNRCWNVDPGSVASRVTVEVGFSLNRDGTVVGNEVRLISSDGDQSATNTAFEAARRAVLRCQSGGYQLPDDKYEQWKEAIVVFDPSGMRLR